MLCRGTDMCLFSYFLKVWRSRWWLVRFPVCSGKPLKLKRAVKAAEHQLDIHFPGYVTALIHALFLQRRSKGQNRFGATCTEQMLWSSKAWGIRLDISLVGCLTLNVNNVADVSTVVRHLAVCYNHLYRHCISFTDHVEQASSEATSHISV